MATISSNGADLNNRKISSWFSRFCSRSETFPEHDASS